LHFLTLLAATGLSSTAAIDRNIIPANPDIKFYYLKIQVKEGQSAAKSKYNDLYLFISLPIPSS
jgi:hypothetical protein